MYMLKLGGSEDGRHQGTALVEDDKLYLRQVPRDKVKIVTATLFEFWKANREDGENLGAYHRRIGVSAILNHLRENPDTAPLLEKTAPPVYLPHGSVSANGHG